MFVDADRAYRNEAHLPAPLRLVRQAWPHHLADYREPAGIAVGITAKARIEHGRWIVDCPFGCNGAQFASKQTRLFFCVDCLHSGKAEGRWIAVKFPDDIDAIEAELMLRPQPLTRNWFPHETLDDLRVERIDQENASLVIARLEGDDTLPPVPGVGRP